MSHVCDSKCVLFCVTIQTVYVLQSVLALQSWIY